jgi:hypothetical protein
MNRTPSTDEMMFATIGSHLTVGAVVNRMVFGPARGFAPEFEMAVKAKLATAERMGLVRRIADCCQPGTTHWEAVDA